MLTSKFRDISLEPSQLEQKNQMEKASPISFLWVRNSREVSMNSLLETPSWKVSGIRGSIQDPVIQFWGLSYRERAHHVSIDVRHRHTV